MPEICLLGSVLTEPYLLYPGPTIPSYALLAISRLWPSDNDDDIFFSQIARYISYCGKVYLFEIVTFLMFDLFVGTIFVTS